jgi:hypothetical protein
LGSALGVIGQSNSSHGYGVYGLASATTGTNFGGCFDATASPFGRGLYSEGGDIGIQGVGDSFGVSGETYTTFGSTYGIWGFSYSTAGSGVRGDAYAGTGTNYGIYGRSFSSGGYGGYFYGDVHITGALSKGSGSFLIDHPLDPENKLLRHNFIESPENLLIYRGVIQLDAQGEGTVELPGYFRALTKEGEASIQLTPLRVPFVTAYVWGSEFDRFTIRGESNQKVSWMVLAERDDPVIHRLARPVEEDKGPENKYCDRGKLLYPGAYGYSESMGRDYEHRQEARHHRERIPEITKRTVGEP